MTNEPVEFKEKKSEVKVAPKRVKLDAEESEHSRIGTLVRDIPFTDYSVNPPEELIFEAIMTPIAMSEKKAIIKRCTTHDRAGIPEIDFERYSEMILSRTFGFDEVSWKRFTETHPIGLNTKLSLIANEINGEGNFSKEDIEKLKNLASQEQ